MEPTLMAYLPALGYLTVGSVLIAATRKVPVWLHPCALAAGLAAQVAISGWWTPLVSLGVAALLFVVLVGVAARTASGVSLFAIVTSIALLPVAGWPYLLLGLLAGAGMAVWRTWRSFGSGRVTWLTMDTLATMGVSPTGALTRPDISRIPTRDMLTDVHQTTTTARKVRMYVPPYLLFGVAVGAAVTYLTHR